MFDPFRFYIDPATVTSTASNVAPGAASARVNLLNGNTLLLSNDVDATFIRFGRGDVTVSATDGFRLPAGFVGRMTVPQGCTHMAYIRETLDSKLSIQTGEGV